ncbi:T9SS type A sorting domain-containing protein [Flavobacterium sp. CS20]|uniref:T9SS type A sorting domain-containing protein n=1 Tax=Flavobacterium sp. CS20 TaxID=2775246 RepID=UPI001B3A2D00|nr:T9SS type A sorting domain-containing protein [Flavobacterium sp. CS20]QTY26146.1 T9SS type A sorting domain-containing protein [Flavobacterium sp. CS20]
MKIINITLIIFICALHINVSYAQTPDWQWAKRGGGTVNLQGSEVFSTGVERILDLAIDQNDNYYFLAEVGASQTDYDGTLITTYSSNGAYQDIYMFSTDCQGNFRWSKSIGGRSIDRANSIVVDANDNIYISGITRNFGSPAPHFSNDTIKTPAMLDGSMEEARKSMFIIKYDDQGNFQWLQEPEGPVNYFGAPLQKTVIEPSGRTHSLVRFGPGTHLDGQLTVTDSLGQSAIIVYDTNGNLENFIPLDMQPGLDIYDYQLAYDPNLDRYYIADTVRGTEPELSINGFGATTGDDKAFYLAALDNQGQVVWYHENNNVGGWSLGDIAVDDNGDIYFTGYQNNNFSNSSTAVDSFAGYTFEIDPIENDNQHPFLIKLDSNGNLIWGTNALRFSPFPGRSIAINGNDVYLGLGSLNNEWDGMPFGTGVSGVGLLATDNAVLRFNKTTGALQEVIPMPSASIAFDMIIAMDIDSNGNIVVGGHFGGSLLTADPNKSIFKTGGDTDFFIAQYGTGNCTLSTEEFSNSFDIKLYPQPASDKVFLQSQIPIMAYTIYNLQGQKIKQAKLDNNRIDIQQLSTGLYLIKVTNAQAKSQVLKLIVE